MRFLRGIFWMIPVIVLLFTACGRNDANDQKNVLRTESDPSLSTSAMTAETEAPLPVYDLDLTECSATVVYAEVFNMMNTPDEFVGKRIRMEGICATYAYPDHLVYGCIIADATACCKQGMEFVLTDDYEAEDYPKPGSEIVVSGIFDLYQAGEFTFCHLRDCELEAETPAS